MWNLLETIVPWQVHHLFFFNETHISNSCLIQYCPFIPFMNIFLNLLIEPTVEFDSLDFVSNCPYAN